MTHQPNTPRERTADGRRVDEPVQCEQCLQAWPCEVAVLTAQRDAVGAQLAIARAQLLRRAELMRQAADELGVPGPETPAPIVNASNLLTGEVYEQAVRS